MKYAGAQQPPATPARTSGSRADTNPYDPHHVTLNLVIDLQSTNLIRQQEILRLRSDLDSARSAAQEQRERADDAETRIRRAVALLELPAPAERKDLLEILRPPPEEMV